MYVRTLLTLVNFTIFGITIAIVILFPRYDTLTFFFLLGWMVASFALFYLPFSSRRVGGSSTSTTDTNPFTAGATASADGAPAPPLASPLGFCIYCAAPLSPGATVCPTCGHAVPRS